MRAKRSKQYRKLMKQYGLLFGFREPYQIIVDAQILLDAAQFKMDFVGLLESTLHGQIKPMITQCSMRHLYAAEPKNELVIEHAKAFERRRCNHHDLERPLSTLACLSSVVDAKESHTNKHRYVIASQDSEVRDHMRSIPGVPIIYLKRSVMIMEPMNHATEQAKNKAEGSKLRDGLKQLQPAKAVKRKMADSNVDPGEELREGEAISDATPVRKKVRGPKGPNPLSVKKSKKRTATETVQPPTATVKSREPNGLVPEKHGRERRRRRRRYDVAQSESEI